jgi:preprotein translocase subunit SecG
MNVIVNILLIIFVPVCILLILMVLLQAGKGGGLSGAFGGMGTAQPFLGARGTVDFLSKLTIYLAIGFMALSLVLSISYGPSRTIKVKDTVPEATETQGGKVPGANPSAKPVAGKAPISSITIPAGKPTPVQKTAGTPTGTSGSTQTPASTPSGK